VLGAPQDANLLLEPRDFSPKRRDLALELLATRFSDTESLCHTARDGRPPVARLVTGSSPILTEFTGDPEGILQSRGYGLFYLMVGDSHRHHGWMGRRES